MSDPRPASELVYASGRLPLCWISNKRPKPTFQMEARPSSSPTCSSRSQPRLSCPASFQLFGLQTLNSSLTLLFLLYSPCDPSANLVTAYPHCAHLLSQWTGLPQYLQPPPGWSPVSAMQSQHRSPRVLRAQDHVRPSRLE